MRRRFQASKPVKRCNCWSENTRKYSKNARRYLKAWNWISQFCNLKDIIMAAQSISLQVPMPRIKTASKLVYQQSQWSRLPTRTTIKVKLTVRPSRNSARITTKPGPSASYRHQVAIAQFFAIYHPNWRWNTMSLSREEALWHPRGKRCRRRSTGQLAAAAAGLAGCEDNRCW